jgi:hypothetical protein
MLAAIMRRHALPLALALVCALAGASRAATAPRYYFALEEVHAVDGAPAEISVKAKTILRELLAARPEFVASLDGAPNPASDPEGFKKLLAARKIAAYQVAIKITEYDRKLAPNDKPGRSGQLLTIRVGVSLIGSKIPGGVLALAGTGGATIAAEVGANVRPREEESAMDEALKNALVQAVDAAVVEMKRPPPKAPPKKKRK